MRRFLKISAAVLLMVSLAGSYAWGDVDALERVLRSGQIGNGNDHWLEKESVFAPGRYDRVAVIFGWNDDHKACASIARALHDAYSERYRCIAAN